MIPGDPIIDPGMDARKAANDREADVRRMKERYATLFKSPDGREVLKNLMSLHGFDVDTGIESPVVFQGEKPCDAARRDGAREVIRHVLAMAGFSLFEQFPTPKKS